MGRRGRGVFLLVAAGIVIVDQISKAIMTAALQPRGSIEVIPGLFSLTYVRNTGAVFGLFRSMPSPWRDVLLTLIPLAAVAAVIAIAARTPPHRQRPLVALGLILGGAIGNLVDRVRLGSVVDFLDVYVGTYHWPAFNVADSAICIGVALLIWDLGQEPARQAQAADEDRASGAAGRS